jgi:uncharacterized protein YjbJ (UPF0337 family)
MLGLTEHLGPNPTVDEVIGRIGALLVGLGNLPRDTPYKGVAAKEGKPFGGRWRGPQDVISSGGISPISPNVLVAPTRKCTQPPPVSTRSEIQRTTRPAKVYDLRTATLVGFKEKRRMSETDNKVEGKIKEGVGEVTGDHSLEAEGAAQKGLGNAEEASRKAGGKVEEIAGAMTGNRSQEVEGKIRQQ